MKQSRAAPLYWIASLRAMTNLQSCQLKSAASLAM
jgi:hypothetical protein